MYHRIHEVVTSFLFIKPQDISLIFMSSRSVVIAMRHSFLCRVFARTNRYYKIDIIIFVFPHDTYVYVCLFKI